MRTLMLMTIVVAIAAAPALSQAEDGPAMLEAAGGCQASASTLQTAGMLGALGGGVMERGLGKRWGAKLPGAAVPTLGVFVADRLACMLNSQERLQSEQATMQAVEQGVGGQSNWRSAARPTVRGSSTVIAEAHEQNGALCRNVSDVIVVNGEESTVSKRLCRAPGAAGFVLAA